MEDVDREPCGALQTEFVNFHTFLGYSENSQTIELISAEDD